MFRKFVVVLLLLCMQVPSWSYADQAILSIAIEWTPSYGTLSEMNQTICMLSISKQRLIVQEKRSATGELLSEKDRTVTPEIVQLVLQTMQRNDFFTLPQYIETGVMDGCITMITVVTDTCEYTVSGLNANEYGPEAFRQIWQVMMMAYAEGKG